LLQRLHALPFHFHLVKKELSKEPEFNQSFHRLEMQSGALEADFLHHLLLSLYSDLAHGFHCSLLKCGCGSEFKLEK
jgi:hypothetical protein